MDTKFARGALYKIWEGENVQNLARFVTTFDFDRKYPWKGSRYRKSEKYWINNISSSIRRKKLVNFGPQTKKLQSRMSTHPTGLFRETIFRPSWDAGPSNFYTPYNSLNVFSSRTWGVERPRAGLCPIFLVDYIFTTYINKKAQLSLTNPRDAKAYQKLLQFDVLTTLSLTILVYLHSFSCCCVRNMRNPAKFSENSNL